MKHLIITVLHGVQIAFLEFDKSHFEISSTETYENCSLGPKIHFEISIVSNYPYFEISIVEIQNCIEKIVGI